MQNVTAVFLAARKSNAEVLSILLDNHADAAVRCDMVHVVSPTAWHTAYPQLHFEFAIPWMLGCCRVHCFCYMLVRMLCS